MKVFISWSKSYSHAVAEALHKWLPYVVQDIKPFVSSVDIYAGARWQAEVSAELEGSNFGLICVTAQNQREPWLNFEAGALSKAVEASRVVPIAIDLKPTDVVLPFSQFQVQPLTEDGIARVIESINSVMPSPLSEDLLRRSVRQWWPELETQLANAKNATLADGGDSDTGRSIDEKLDDILSSVRSLTQSQFTRWSTMTIPVVWDPSSGASYTAVSSPSTSTIPASAEKVSEVLVQQLEGDYGPIEISADSHEVLRSADGHSVVAVRTSKDVPDSRKNRLREVFKLAGWDLRFATLTEI